MSPKVISGRGAYPTAPPPTIPPVTTIAPPVPPVGAPPIAPTITPPIPLEALVIPFQLNTDLGAFVSQVVTTAVTTKLKDPWEVVDDARRLGAYDFEGFSDANVIDKCLKRVIKVFDLMKLTNAIGWIIYMGYHRGSLLVREYIDQFKDLHGFVSDILPSEEAKCDSEEKGITKPAVKQWLDEFKDAVYEADDFLDEVAYEALRSEMEAESQTSRVISTENTNNLSCRLSDAFGRDDDKENIVKLLLDDGNGSDLGVVPIVGMGGIGKTTLAQLVFSDNRVQEWFNPRIWIFVSKEYDVFQVTKDIFKAVTGDNCDTKNADEVQVGLKESLMGKRFLLVSDDVRYAKYTDWDILQRPLNYGAKGSKIVITTRNESVALIMRTVPSYYLKELSHHDCWLLFVRHVFENGNSDAYPDLEVIGKKIAKKCDGLPLAAKVFAGLMHSKEKVVNEWDAILQGEGNGSSLKELGKLQYLQGELSIHNLQYVVEVEDVSAPNLKGKWHLRKLELLWNSDLDDSQCERSVLEQL
ncbi:hypothetical protein GH714_006693 [Hevea brasiliensis]|uniref:NB-ARC domain-containing protein n=1 Tax=Hevea brasiliensis TaxID=3981 RepID=A0A6A6LIT9_HEVBR|nr:hypothetical protein GH714_006693 [Hevea brasiliensis]